jgi:hypothetical protein
VVRRPTKGEVRTTLFSTILNIPQQGIYGSGPPRVNQEKALLKVPHFPGKNLEQLLGLPERNLVHTPLYGEEGKEDIFG